MCFRTQRSDFIREKKRCTSSGAYRIGDPPVKLIATVTPANATNRNVVWSTDNPAVATVNEGTVEFTGIGDATITASTVDGNHTATCRVIVDLPTGTEGVEASSLKAWATNGNLYISGLRAGESLRVFNVTGQLIYQGIARYSK